MRRFLVLICSVPFAFAACGDSSPGGSNENIDPNDVYAVDTLVEPISIEVGGTATVTCTVADREGNPVETPVEFTVGPDEGRTVEGSTITGTAIGTYEIICSAPDLGAYDTEPAFLEVTAGPPATVIAEVEPDTIVVGGMATVTCTVFDAHGNEIVDATTTATAPADVTVSEKTVTSVRPGIYPIECVVEGADDVESTPAQLTVEPGAPVSIELVADPAKPAYSVGNQVTLSWTVMDMYGNVISDLPATLDAPATGVSETDAETHKYRFELEGIYTFTVELDDTPEVNDELTLICDETGPTITITYPERGVTLLGTGDPIEVTGTVTDDYGDVDKVIINGDEVELAEDGAFSHSIDPIWGVNPLKIYASDEFENQSKVTPTFQYSSAYTPFVDNTAEGVKTDDGLQLLLGQGLLDDGVHDHNDIDDIATLLEVVLEGMDIVQLVAALGEDGFSTTFPILNYGYDVPVVGMASLSGDLTVNVKVLEVDPTGTITTDIGPTTVTLDSVDGGIAMTLTLGDDTIKGLQLALEITIQADFEAGLTDLGLSVPATASATIHTAMTVDKVKFAGTILLDKDPGGPLTAGIDNLTLELENANIEPIQTFDLAFEIDVPLVGPVGFDIPVSDFIDLNTLTSDILNFLINDITPFLLDWFGPQIEDFITNQLTDLLNNFAFETEFPMPEFFGPKDPPVVLQIFAELSSAKFSDPGGHLGLAFGTYAEQGVTRDPEGAIQRQGCLIEDTAEFTYDWQHELAAGLKTDAINNLLFSLWWSGFLNGPLDLGSLLGDSAPIPIEDMYISLDPWLAPVLNDCDKSAGVLLEIGDLRADLAGSLLGVTLDSNIFLDLSLLVTFEATEEGLFITMAEMKYFDVEVIEVADTVDDPDAVKTLLEDQLGTILSSFLVGESFGPIEIPTIDLGSLVEGLPPAELNLTDINVTKQSGYVLVEGELD